MISMSIQRFNQRRDKIRSLLGRAKQISDEELKSDVAKYAVIRISGLIETTVRDCYDEYASGQSSPSVHQFVSKKLQGFQNPNVKKIVDLAGLFNENWSSELKQIDDQIKAAVDGIVNARHGIAHGGDAGMTLVAAEKYFKLVLQFLETIQRQCGLRQ